jgi:multidrug efflux pump subunit AcrB
MSIGVSVANAVLLVTFARDRWLSGLDQRAAVLSAATSRVRPILMTSLAMIAGMLPMALGVGEGGEQSAPLGRAVIGGLACSTIATLLVLPAIYVLLARRGRPARASLEPLDAAPAAATAE